MTNACGTCGHTHSQAIGEAETLGLAQEFQSGIHTCCQIAEWAAEQRLAWFEATLGCGKPNADATVLDEMESVLVRVRTQPAQVPWFRNTNDLGR